MGAISHSQVRLEAAAGECAAKGKGQGQWWVGGGDTFTSAPLRSSCYQLGLSEIHGRLGWRVSLVDLGSMSLQEDAWGGRYADGTLGPQPHWSSTGSGSVQGASFGLIAEQPISRFKLSGEVGAFAYRSKWEAVSTHFSSNTSVETNPDARYGTALYYGAGLGYTRRHATVEASFRRYPNIRFNTLADNSDNVGASSASVNVAMISARWSF